VGSAARAARAEGPPMDRRAARLWVSATLVALLLIVIVVNLL
jgi:hypothetical protein